MPEEKTLVALLHGGCDLWKSTQGDLDQYAYNQIAHLPIARHFTLDDPLIPLQLVGRELGICTPSQLLSDIHSEYGLWFGFRALFTLKEKAQELRTHPKARDCCYECVEKMCLKGSTFREQRALCPIGSEHRYTEEQINYHEKMATTFQQLSLKQK